MVLRGEMTTTTARRPERPKSLHNFALPSLKWGSQRHLKCMKIESSSCGSGSGDHRLRRRSPALKFSGSSVSIPFRFGESEHRSSSDDKQRRRSRKTPFESAGNGGEGEGIEEYRVRLMSDLKTETEQLKKSMFTKDALEEEGEVEISPVKPWNLRKRRAACKEPNDLNQTKNGFVSIEERVVKLSPTRNDSTRLAKERGGVVEAETATKEMTTTRPKFSTKLTKKEIEEDFMAVLGHRPPRRPKKRPRTVQKKLDSLHPAFYLAEVTFDAYKVPEETKR